MKIKTQKQQGMVSCAHHALKSNTMLTLRSPLKTSLHFNKLGRTVRSKTAHAWQKYCLFRSDQTAKENPP
ncbi:MAG: hypothetical protein Q7T29_01050, partial [Gallionella sp.]|nr:hypothetical protein [Gallionella sp.]